MRLWIHRIQLDVLSKTTSPPAGGRSRPTLEFLPLQCKIAVAAEILPPPSKRFLKASNLFDDLIRSTFVLNKSQLNISNPPTPK